jgi:NAD(P)-dependent dehydrogenase (short-subunit alcohol dehydrogenase family)
MTGPDASTPLARKLSGRVALVTGGGKGLGRVLAENLAEGGAAVAVSGRSLEDLRETVGVIEGKGGRALAVAFDVADRKAVDAGVAEVARGLGRVDLLVNNAGLWGPIDDLWDCDPQEWWRTMEVHVGGAFHCSRAVIPGMLARGGGRIVNIVSHAGVHRWPTCSAYSVSKAAVIKLTENLAVELSRKNVAVFAYHPGLLTIGLGEQASDMQAAPGSAADRAAAWIRSEFAAGRTVTPEQAAMGLVTLASGEADGLSGRYLTVFDDLAALERRKDEVQRADSLTLRLREA